MHAIHSRSSKARFASLLPASLALLSFVAFGCGDDDKPPPMPSGHGHIEIGSTQQDGGSLGFVAPHSHDVEVTESAQIGSLTLWSSPFPALNTLEEEEEGLYVLAEGTPVSLELTAVDAGARFTFEGTTIDAPGESVLIGPAPFHTQGEWQVVLPTGTDTGEYNLSFRFISNPPFAPSAVTTFTIIPSAGHHEEDDHEGGDEE